LTYSIIGLDRSRMMMGIATASGSVAVGSRVPWARYPVGAVATQAYTNPALGPMILEFMEEGSDPQESLERALSLDPREDLRQVAVMDFKGHVAVHEGSNIPDWHGYIKEPPQVVCISNLVRGPEVCEEAVRSFKRSKGALPERLLEALRGGHEAGGDRRGDRSSALIVVGKTDFSPYYDFIINLRVDYSEDPILDLMKVYSAYTGQRP